jgi:undecaprenyl diphosphate synthase
MACCDIILTMVSKVSLPKAITIPDHIAIVLDGNRRWARAHGFKPWQGHKAGYEAVKKLAYASREFGVHTFTIWAFSTENWDRPQEEIDELFRLLKRGLTEFEKECHKYHTRLIHLGRKDRFPKELSDEIARVEAVTKKYKDHVLNLALDYGGRDEIVRAVRRVVEDKIPAEKVDEKLFESYLDTHDQPYPYPDLFIRTSGEQRTSGLLPWQMTYAEYYFATEHLPDFTPEKLREAILDYSRRRRRFGGNDAVEHLTFDPKITAKLELSWWRLANVPEGMRLRDYAMKHLKEQYGLSKELAKEAAKYMIEALAEEKAEKWDKAKEKMKKFYQLIKGEIKLAFEPRIVASMEVDFAREMGNKDSVASASEAEGLACQHLAEVYRISLLQATKAAHLRVLAGVEKNLALAGLGEEHWEKAEDYLQKYYSALKERVA